MKDKTVLYKTIFIIIADRVRHGRCNNFQVPPAKQEKAQEMFFFGVAVLMKMKIMSLLFTSILTLLLFTYWH